MVFRQRFLAGLLWRAVLLVLAALGVAALLSSGNYPATTAVGALLFLGTVLSLWRHVQRTNTDLARFLESVRFGDLTQRFGHEAQGSGFSDVSAALESGLKAMREERSKLLDENRFYTAVLDDAPVALLTVGEERRVELTNKAARRLFARHSGTAVEDFAGYGATFTQALINTPMAGPKLVPLMIDGIPQMAIVSAASVQRLGGLVHAFAVQPIQSELNAVEVAAQTDLMRVLTHEIMNSMTPVTSLAHTAASLLATTDNGSLTEARTAVETLARRADGVMRFVESYREISRKPQVRRRRFELLSWAHELEALFRASEAVEGLELHVSVEPPNLTIDADPDLLSQVLINLLHNGAEAALTTSENPTVSLRFSATRSEAVQIDITDNGPGIPADLTRDIFLPFFTTKPKGTGVGLSVARQLVLAHNGSIMAENPDVGGSRFRVII